MACTVALAVAGALASGCSKDKDDEILPDPVSLGTSSQPPILLIGVDGLEWDVMQPLLRSGRLPAMASLMERGTFGLLQTFKPTMSPVIWTSIATGKRPAEHGIVHFVKAGRAGSQGPELFTNRDRRTKAFWNIAGDFGKRVAVIGWWMTFPVEPVNGVMVAQTNTSEQIDILHGRHVWKGRLIEGLPDQVHPPDRHAPIMSVVADVDRLLPELTREIFGEFQYPMSTLGKRLWENCTWAFRADATYVQITEGLLAEPGPYDILAVYVGGTDVVGHQFWRYMEPDLYQHPPSAEQTANFGDVIEDYYTYTDRVIGRFVALARPDARVIIVSDHGMRPYNQKAQFDPDDPPRDVNSGHHKSAEPGVFIAAGTDIVRKAGAAPVAELSRSQLDTSMTVLDVTPLLLALMDVPIGEDMGGELRSDVISPAFLAGHPVRTVPTHDTDAWCRQHQQGDAEVPGHDERIDQLKSLGYVE